ncbi:hypothetical protein FEM48_Zijuj06G0181000 [Ziziphus jujuba var. spinosa]|uniref:NPH3 domain-containing protein n=1 Tax=Ziziphus jujuba var. spinosa TaxID=714518 RepID=A0A978VAT7_ZIZJJ|nr:hypothetical protein FEM48_Zijuj06G0181000 [Ziziphus jujuba var. spinosa]
MYVEGDSEDKGDVYRPNARRTFVLDWKPEDLTTLSLQLYEPRIHETSQRGVPTDERQRPPHTILGYAREVQYEIDCAKRIVKYFYDSFSAPRISASNITKSIAVAEHIEEFLTEVASDIDLKVETFITLEKMSVAASLGRHRSSDGLYKAIDIYLNKHRHLTASEKDQEARQVLFFRQLQLRDTIMKEVQGFSDDKAQEDKEEEEVEHGCGEEKMRREMEKMSEKVTELERMCFIMKRKIEGGCRRNVGMEKKKISLWGEMKRKFGCISTMHNYSCQVKKKKVHPKNLV